MVIDGEWDANYAAKYDARADAEPDEMATLRLKNGVISGTDPHGGRYSGTYALNGNQLIASIDVTGENPDDETVFSNLDYPLRIKIDAEYRSPDHFSGVATVNGTHEIILNCRRKRDIE